MASFAGRKGQGVEPLMILSVAVAVLALVGFGFYLHYSEGIQFFDFLPGFELDNSTVDEQEIIGYDLEKGSVEYYDGSQWRILEDRVDVGKESINGDELKQVFLNFYVLDKNGNREEPREHSPMFNTLGEVYGFDEGEYQSISGASRSYVVPYEISSSILLFPYTEFKSDEIGQAAVKMNLYIGRTQQKEGSVCGKFTLAINNELYFEKFSVRIEQNGLICKSKGIGAAMSSTDLASKQGFSGEHIREITSLGIIWRDSVLEKPIEIAGARYCVERLGSRLVVRTDKFAEGETCEVVND